MTVRRAQLIGYTPGCMIQVDWNRSRVYTGPVASMGTQDDLVPMCEWQTDTSLVGHIPFSIYCTSGLLWFANIHVNHFSRGSSQVDLDLKDLSEEDNMCQPYLAYNFSDSDGKDNVTIDNIPQSRHDLDRYSGVWHWKIIAGQRLNCLFKVDVPPID